MLIQSIFSCKTQSDIEGLVRYQPDPKIFYKVFLELDMQNMVRYLSFDSKSIKTLLSDNNKEYFDFNYPLFYKADSDG